jgi:hypothetical protein
MVARLRAPLFYPDGISTLVTTQAKFITVLWGYKQKLRDQYNKKTISNVVFNSCFIHMS